ncbi:FAD-dependent monooxygenase [Streptomyces sp. SKN60]|uniref:FAD-dependent monooxygenase n=1 Tax=Streptomyces sp. SKN60 TaxID=2855506 RepID=UPI0022477F0F|nr:FAD-dependent monooxygenase [Streptomyces sp. SKN60]MCX2181888.1 FAD-dependent monooxygenase [Streptomyces sp. SKN60]
MSKNTDTDTDTEVVIVGAGPTGLVLAIDLARRGVRALLVEQADGLFPGSRGKGLQPRSLEVLDDLGVLPAVLVAGAPYPLMRGWEGAEPQGEWDMMARSEPTEQVPYANVLLVPQFRTQELLYERLRELGGAVRFGTALTGFRQTADAVEAELSTGETVRAAYLVACDGGRSTVRRALGIGMTGETVDPRPMLVADVRLAPGTVVDRGNWHLWATAPGGGVALCPLPGGELFQLVAGFEDESAIVDTSPEGVRSLLAARTPLAPEDVAEVRWSSDFRARAAMADRFRDGRVFLAGDAAHVHSPAGGQGLNTSVQDAYNLGWKLGRVLRHGAPAALLDSYETERQPVAADVLGLSTRLHRASTTGRGTQRGSEVQQLDLGYRDSPWSVETRPGLPEDALRAGDRAPDGPYGAGRLFDLFRGPHLTLLAVGVPLPPLLGSPSLRPAHLPAYEAYGTGLFLIRPDGYVGWAGPDAEGLDAHLANLGEAPVGAQV